MVSSQSLSSNSRHRAGAGRDLAGEVGAEGRDGGDEDVEAHVELLAVQQQRPRDVPLRVRVHL